MPAVIIWSYQIESLDAVEPIRVRSLRKSRNYVRLAEWLRDHRNDKVKQGFRLRDLPADARKAIQAYKTDVTNWVAARMIQAIRAKPSTQDGVLLASALEELHKLPWYEGSSDRGFFFVNAAAGSYEKTYMPSGLGMKAMGSREKPQIIAHGVGVWKEPDPAEYEMWQTRLFLIQMNASTNRLATAALSGQHIGSLSPGALLKLAEGLHAIATAALPPSATGVISAKQLITKLPKRLPSLPPAEGKG
jgi:hypothetical protein